MNISIDNNILTIGENSIEFASKISHAEKFGEVVLVITDYGASDLNENVWGVNGEGKIIWQIQKVEEVEFEGIKYLGVTHPYTAVYKVDERTARLVNWEGGYFEVNPVTGKFTKNIIEFRKGKRPW